MKFDSEQPIREDKESEKESARLTKQVRIYTPTSEDTLYNFAVIKRVSPAFASEYVDGDYKIFTLHATINSLIKHLRKIETRNMWNGKYAGAILREFEKGVYDFNWRDVLFSRSLDWMVTFFPDRKEEMEAMILENEKKGINSDNTDPLSNFSSLQLSLIVALCNSGEITLYDKEIGAYASEISYYGDGWSDSYSYKGVNIANYRFKVV